MTGEDVPRRDPDAPLPSAPEPWAESAMPLLREGAPWHMTEMIEAEPALAVRILERLKRDGSARRLADLVAATFDAGRPIVVVGCGTSEHGAQAVAAQLRMGLQLRDLVARHGDGQPVDGDDSLDVLTVAAGDRGAPVAIQAFEASLLHGLARGGLAIGVSHEGGTWATIQALERAGLGDARVALITAARQSPAALGADVVLDTVELDQSWCHTVGYLSPIVAGLATSIELLDAADPQSPAQRAEYAEQLRELLADGLSPSSVAATEALARELAKAERIVVIASGVDQIAGRELALKIEEGAHLPAILRDTETVLHGHLAGMGDGTGIIAIAADDDGQEDSRARRLNQALRAVRELGLPAGAILGPGLGDHYDDLIDPDLTPAGRIVVGRQQHGGFAGPGRSLLATAVPLQLLTERLARERGVNPDPIRRDDPRYLRAAGVADPEG